MAGFDAAVEVEKLSYDFTAFGGRKSDIPEPTIEQVTRFWTEYIGLLRTSQAAEAKAASDRDTIPETDEDRDDRIRTEIIEGQHRSMAAIERRRELISELCSKSPSVEELIALPHRVLNAFEAYMMGALAPEALSTATTQ